LLNEKTVTSAALTSSPDSKTFLSLEFVGPSSAEKYLQQRLDDTHANAHDGYAPEDLDFVWQSVRQILGLLGGRYRFFAETAAGALRDAHWPNKTIERLLEIAVAMHNGRADYWDFAAAARSISQSNSLRANFRDKVAIGGI
jgi:hypothetical protein